MSAPTWKPPTDTCCAAGTRSLSPRCARSSLRWTGASRPRNSGLPFEVAQRRQGIDSRRVDDLAHGGTLVRAVRHQEGARSESWYARAAGRHPGGAIREGGHRGDGNVPPQYLTTGALRRDDQRMRGVDRGSRQPLELGERLHRHVQLGILLAQLVQERVHIRLQAGEGHPWDGADVDAEFSVARIDPVENAAAQGHAKVDGRAARHSGVDRVAGPKL